MNKKRLSTFAPRFERMVEWEVLKEKRDERLKAAGRDRALASADGTKAYRSYLKYWKQQ